MPEQVVALRALEPRPALMIALGQVDAVELRLRQALHRHARHVAQLVRRGGASAEKQRKEHAQRARAELETLRSRVSQLESDNTRLTEEVCCT